MRMDIILCTSLHANVTDMPRGAGSSSKASRAEAGEEGGSKIAPGWGEGGPNDGFEYPSAEAVGQGSSDAGRNHSAWVHADSVGDSNVTMLQAASGGTPPSV